MKSQCYQALRNSERLVIININIFFSDIINQPELMHHCRPLPALENKGEIFLWYQLMMCVLELLLCFLREEMCKY